MKSSTAFAAATFACMLAPGVAMVHAQTAPLPPSPPTSASTLPGTRQTGVVSFEDSGTPVTIRSWEPDSITRDGYRISFEALDSDGDGLIGHDEAAVHSTLDSEFRAVDANGDGKASRAELSGWLVTD